ADSLKEFSCGGAVGIWTAITKYFNIERKLLGTRRMNDHYPRAFSLRRVVVFLLQLMLIAWAAISSFFIRFEFTVDAATLQLMITYVLFAWAVKTPFLQIFGLNKGWWRYSSV